MTDHDLGTFLGRLNHRLDIVGLTPEGASRAAKLNRDAIRMLKLNPTRRPRADRALALAKVLKCRIEWLMDGEPPETDSPDVANQHDGLQSRNRRNATALDASDLERFSEDYALIPEIDINIGLGAGGEVVPVYEFETSGDWRPSDSVKARAPIRRAWLAEMGLHPDFTDVVQFRGDSMSPVIEDGDWGFIDRRARVPSPPDIYVLWDGWSCVAKHLELIKRDGESIVRIISANEVYQTQEEPLHSVNVIGRVARIITRPRRSVARL